LKNKEIIVVPNLFINDYLKYFYKLLSFFLTLNSPEKKKCEFELLLISARLASLQHSSAPASATAAEQKSQKCKKSFFQLFLAIFKFHFCDMQRWRSRGRSTAANSPTAQKFTKVHTPISSFRANLKFKKIIKFCQLSEIQERDTPSRSRLRFVFFQRFLEFARLFLKTFFKVKMKTTKTRSRWNN